MTIICVDKWSIAADSQETCGGIITSLAAEKIRVVKGSIYAMTGASIFWEPLIEWHQAGAKREDAPKGDKDNTWTLIVIDKQGTYQYTYDTNYPDHFPVPWAWGANCDTALGVLLAGKTAAETVAIMCEKSVHAGGEVQVVNIAEALGLQAVREAAE